jgi:hypothetical protein
MRTHRHTYHPAYGVAADMSERVIAHAIEHGIIAASEQFKLAQSTIYRWLADARATSGGNA